MSRFRFVETFEQTKYQAPHRLTSRIELGANFTSACNNSTVVKLHSYTRVYILWNDTIFYEISTRMKSKWNEQKDSKIKVELNRIESNRIESNRIESGKDELNRDDARCQPNLWNGTNGRIIAGLRPVGYRWHADRQTSSRQQAASDRRQAAEAYCQWARGQEANAERIGADPSEAESGRAETSRADKYRTEGAGRLFAVTNARTETNNCQTAFRVGIDQKTNHLENCNHRYIHTYMHACIHTRINAHQRTNCSSISS